MFSKLQKAFGIERIWVHVTGALYGVGKYGSVQGCSTAHQSYDESTIQIIKI